MTTDLLYEDLSYKIRGIIFKIYNTLGFGHKESVYHKALALEFNKHDVPFEEEQAINVTYENQRVGSYKPDFIVDQKILIEIKAIPFMGRDPETQMIYYLKGTQYKLGLLVNFGSNKLEIRRKIWTGSAVIAHQRKSANIRGNL